MNPSKYLVTSVVTLTDDSLHLRIYDAQTRTNYFVSGKIDQDGNIEGTVTAQEISKGKTNEHRYRLNLERTHPDN